MTWLTNLFTTVKKDEAWVVAEIRKGLALVQSVEHTAQVDVEGIFTWIQQHQLGIENLAQKALTDIQLGATIASGIVPQYAAPIAAAAAIANTAIQAGAVAVNKLAVGIQNNSTPMSTLVGAYVTTKSAADAVSALLKTATTPATVPAAAPAA